MRCTARKPYIDNIRSSTVLLVMIYHVCYMFNGVGVLGGIPNAQSIPAFDALAYVVYPWFMVLLFVISGISARYSLQKRTVKQFLKERAVKLLVPSTLGLFVIHWITGYLNLKMGGALLYIPTALVYPISVLSGIGPLWFIQMLFVFSCILALLKKIDKNDRVWKTCEKANLLIILSLYHETEYGWYLCLDNEHIVGGLGVIENDFHDRKDLAPNVCAVYTEQEYRCQGIAGQLLDTVVDDMKSKGISPIYLITDHTNFYERYGWEFLCMVQGDNEPNMTRMYIYR